MRPHLVLLLHRVRIGCDQGFDVGQRRLRHEGDLQWLICVMCSSHHLHHLQRRLGRDRNVQRQLPTLRTDGRDSRWVSERVGGREKRHQPRQACGHG